MNKQQKQGRRGIKLRRRGQEARGDSRALTHPPQFVPTLRLRHKMRFLSNGSSTTTGITRGNLLNLYETALTAITSSRLFAAVKLRKVSMWAIITQGSVPVTVTLEWVGLNAPSIIKSDTSMGVVPASITATPPKDASNRWWSITGQNESEILFNLTFPTNTIVDIEFDARLFETEAVAAGDVPAGASAGKLYANYLDGLSGNLLVPLVGNTTLP